MDWSHLKVVLAVHRGGSLTAAARLLNLDQTTAGRRLSALEGQLKATLFIRSKAGFVATEAGQIVIETAEQVDAQMEEMRENLSDPTGGVEGVVRLMGNTWMLKRLAENALGTLLTAHPKLEVRMSGRLPPAPLHGEPTIGLWFDASAQGTDEAKPLARVSYAAYRAHFAEADTNNWVIFRDDDAQGPSFTRQLARRLGKDARIATTATDAQILLGAVRAGVGSGVLPCCLGDEDDALRRTSDLTQIDRVLHIHINRDAANIRRVKVVSDWITRSLCDAIGGELL